MYQASQTGGVLSILPFGELQDRVFPARSRMVTWQFWPSWVTVQLPHATSIPLWESVEFESVKFMDVFPHPVVEGFHVPQVGAVVSMRADGD